MATNGTATMAKGRRVVDGAKEAVAADLKQRVGAFLAAQKGTLVELLRETESLTREATLAEVAIGHQREVQGTQRAELDTLALKKKAAEAESAALTKRRLEAEKAVGDAEKANRDAQKELDDLGKAVARLEKDAGTLTRERESLEEKRQRLEDDLVRLRKIRDDYMAGIAKFRQLREEMTA